ncbi:uncharacterized protein LOC143277513 isoform X2 [Babylonia areolata]|uniref:uncharacterized protein LOC143277513 isoform X2 n=1 Tax=Babylonia areolata TaxID=304850 RepID=UPI003FD2ADA2
MMGNSRWTGVMVVILCSVVQADVSFKDCGEDQDLYGEVVRGRTRNFTCTSIRSNQNVTWKLDDFELGTCPPIKLSGTCDTSTSVFGTDKFLPRRTTQSKSVMTILDTELRSLRNGTLHCTSLSSTTCNIDVIEPADGRCQADLLTSAWPWSVHVHCNITGGNSTRHRYGCRLFHKAETTELTEPTEPTELTELTEWQVMKQNTLPTGSAVCNFTTPLNTTVDGHHHYTVKLKPGRSWKNVKFSNDENQISRPSMPSIDKCSYPDLVPEMGNLTCRCIADRVGLPKGWLVWSKRVNGQFNTNSPLRSGKRGETTLEMTTTLTRQDDKIQFRCDVIWAHNITGDIKSFTVGYPASGVDFTVSEGRSVAENREAVFTCSATGGRPSPNITLRREGGMFFGKVKVEGPSPLEHRHAVRCEDSGRYTCVASNGMGPDVEHTDVLNVTCAPRDLSGDIPTVNIEDKEKRFTFDVIANPPPYHVSFFFLGSNPSNPGSSVRAISLTGQCGRKDGAMYTATCTVVMDNVTSAAAEGLYRGSVQNQGGILNFTFEVKVNATLPEPPPAGPSVAVIVGVAVGAVVAIAIAIVIFIVYRCRKKGSKTTKPPGGSSTATTPVKYRAVPNGADREESPLPPPSSPQALLPAGEKGHVYTNVTQGPSGLQPQTDDYAVVQKPEKGGAQGHPNCDTGKVKDSMKGVEEEEVTEPSEAHVYGNINMQERSRGPQDASSPGPQVEGQARPIEGELSPEGLLYVSVDFSDQPPRNRQPLCPQDDAVLYSDVNYKATDG